MAFNFRREDREQDLLFPPSIDDYLPQDHLARFVREVVVAFDGRGRLAAFYARHREDGHGGQAFQVTTMLSILLYAYSIGVTSSRAIQQQCLENLAFRYLSANQVPNFRSVAKFRRRHLEAFEALFVDVLLLCKEAGLVKLGCVAIDGRRVKGNASRDATLTREGLEVQRAELTKQIAELVEKASCQDAAEDAEHGESQGNELPAALRHARERKARVDAAVGVLDQRERRYAEQHQERLRERERIEAEEGRKKGGRLPQPRDPKKSRNTKAPPKANTTDPESRLLKTRGGFVQGYNGQAAADAATGVVVAAHVTQDVVDTRQLEPTLDQIERNLGELPKKAVADTGYWSPENAELEETCGVDLYIATQKDSHQRKAAKTASAPRGRVPRGLTHRERMERKLLTKKGKAAYRKRGPGIETIFGQMLMRGLTHFLLRGVKAVSAEWNLWCATHNVLKLWRARLAC